ncbi:MAG: transglutaminase family protein [Hyphomicrobiaceae bacterium]|nr:transglutaminase family protein [Hyphomicrobiaceae bacterium]
MPRYIVSHRTTYSYSSPVIQSHHLMHLAPRVVPHQTNLRHSLTIEPAPVWRSDRVDYFGNPVTLIAIEDEHRQLSVRAVSEIAVTLGPKPNLTATSAWETIATGGNAGIATEIVEYACGSRHARASRMLYDFARPSFPVGRPVLEGARHLMARIHKEFRFDSTSTDVTTPVETVLKQRSGVCQDFAHLMIAGLRAMGLPARYVSGYLLTYPPAGQKKLEGADASHAWVGVWAPETGWVEFDPTNDVINSGEHIAIAHGRDFDDVSPISGVLLGGGQHSVAVSVDVKPVS